MNPSLTHRMGALLCGALYLPLGLVWAYGMALLFLPLAGLGFWLLRAADRREQEAGIATTAGQARLRAAARALLIVGLAASVIALLATR